MSPFSGTVAEVCRALVATPSEYGEEALIADLVEERCRELGVRMERLGNAIVARTGGDGDAVALVGHLDTVPNWEGGGVGVEGDRIVGRGAADMKGGVAVMFRLLERFAHEPRPLQFVFYDREEGPNHLNGIHAVLAEATLLRTAPAFAVVLEPTGNTVHAGAVGTMNADVTYHGRLAHAARPWEGANAITAAAAALARFAARREEPVVVEGLTFHDTVTITMASGGAARNVVPDRFVLGVNVRVAPGRSLDDAQREVERLAGPEAEVEWLDRSPPATPSVTTPAIADFVRRTGLEVRPKQAWTDVATLQAAGIPALNFGPGEPAQAHQRDEWVSIAALQQCEATLAGYLEG
jgi:succinyl-diaminopimelate desuccinylase